MPFPEIDPVLIHLGPLPIRWYALAYVAGIVLGWWYASRLAKTDRLWPANQSPITGPKLDDLILWATLGIILGGRLGYALFYKPEMFAQIFTGHSMAERLEILQVWTGGMSFHGGFLGVVIALFIFARANGIPALTLGDLIAPVAPIGLLFGRIANFINGELWGRETSVPWAVRFCNQKIMDTFGYCPAGDVPRHPSQLYEAGLEGLLLLILMSLAIWKFKMLKRPGFVMGIFLLGYGLSRAALEFVRQPDAHLANLPLGLTMGMILSIPMMIAGAVLIVRALKKPAAE